MFIGDFFIFAIAMYFVLTCAPGLESVAKKEIEIAGYTVIGS